MNEKNSGLVGLLQKTYQNWTGYYILPLSKEIRPEFPDKAIQSRKVQTQTTKQIAKGSSDRTSSLDTQNESNSDYIPEVKESGNRSKHH